MFSADTIINSLFYVVTFYFIRHCNHTNKKVVSRKRFGFFSTKPKNY